YAGVGPGLYGRMERTLRSARGGFEPHGLVARKVIDALVVGIARVPLHPAPVDHVAAGRGVQALPEVAVLDGIAAGSFPAAADPVGHPQGDALADVLRVGVQGDLAGL